jgi:hypothetical protein
MEQQSRRTASADFCRIVEQHHACGGGETGADQKIAIAGDEVQADAHVCRAAQQVADIGVERVGKVIVPDPVFEQIAEDEQGIDVGGGSVGQEGGEALYQVGPFGPKVQVGYKAGGSANVRRHATVLVLDLFGPLDDHVLARHVLVEALVAGLHILDLIHHVLAFDDTPENAVTPAVLALVIVEEIVVADVYEELSRRGMRIRSPSHGDRVTLVAQAVLGFVFDRLAHRLLVHPRLESAALNHEAVDDPVEDCVVVMAGFDVSEEVGGALRGLLRVEFDCDDAVIGGELDHELVPVGFTSVPEAA